MSKLVQYLLVAIALGVLTGLSLGPHSEILGEVGNLAIRLLKMLATPLLFFGIVDTFCRTRIEVRDGVRLICISILNACVALVISLSIAHWVPIEKIVDLQKLREKLPISVSTAATPDKIHTTAIFDSFVPSNIFQPFLENNVIAVVLLSILVGLAIRAVEKNLESPLISLFSDGFKIVHRILNWVVRLIPLAVFCVVAKITGTSGFSLFPLLGVFIAIVAAGMLIHVGVYYSLLLRSAGFSPVAFFRSASAPLLTALTTGSSLATLPVTLDTLDKMKVPPRYARLAAAVGTNLNHDGILLYEAMAALFVARLYGIHLSLGQQILVCATSVLAAVGIAGVPEAGLITLSLVLNAVGLPMEAIALLMPIDWLIGRLRATVNVASDMTVAHLLMHLEKDATHQ